MKQKMSIFVSGLILVSGIYGDNASAMPVNTPEKTAGLSYFVDASFIYWYAKEDGLDVGESAVINDSGITFQSANGKIFHQSFSYNPGFKVGAGIKGDDWGLHAEYTWLRSVNKTSRDAPANDTTVAGTGVWNLDDWFLQTTSFGKSPTGTHVSSDWQLGLDIVDLLAFNPLYDKKNVMVSGMVGLRTAWIRQKMNIWLTQALASVGSGFFPKQPIESSNSSHSWGIGPKMGLDTKYLLPMGFRFEGLVAASLLYTQFTSVQHHEDPLSTLAVNADGTNVKMGRYSSVRPVMEMGLGLGWKTDWCQNRYGFDILASYDFSLFWGQNVMRKMLDEFWSGTESAANDLYLQGLTVTAGFRF